MVVFVRRQPNPFELAMVVAASAFGLVLLVAANHLNSTIIHKLPHWQILLLGAGLLAGSVPVLIGSFSRKVTGALAEMCGCLLLGFLLGSFTGLVILYTGFSSSTLFFIAFTIAAFARSWQARGEVRDLSVKLGERIRTQEV